MIDIRLETFITLAKTKSFTKSAEILNITQPAVSQHMKFLEDEYGVSLVKKQGRGFQLTEEGKILLKYAEKIDAMYRALSMDLKNKASIMKTYNVGASMTIGGYVLPYILAKHKRLYKNIDILLQVNNTEQILQSLLEEKLNFAIVEGHFDKTKFKYYKLKDDELVLVASPRHKFSTLEAVTIEDVISGNLILREKGSGTREITEESILKLGYSIKDLNCYMEIGSISAIKSLVESNLGYAIVSRETIKKELEVGTLKVIPIKDFQIKREFNFVYLHEDDFIKKFMDFCSDNIIYL